MDVNEAKRLVVEAGKNLVESGLIARTWGNVSCRVDDNTFAVTPSGRSYETLTADEIVLCKTWDASYEGDIKPSSERRIHALVYRTFPDICFVIHTHQQMASVISASANSDMPSSQYGLLGNQVPIAEYGLPGTKKLRANIEKSLKGSKSKAVIMAHHGALCFGRDYEETFQVAKQLEDACTDYLKASYLKLSGQKQYDEKKYYDYYVLQGAGYKSVQWKAPAPLYSSRRTEGGFVLKGIKEKQYGFNDRMPEEAKIHSAIYQKRKDINFISHDTDQNLIAISLTGQSLKPLLDDFAQIVGSSAKCAKDKTENSILHALGKQMGVLVPGCGALCCAATESDLHAVSLIMQKNARTQIGTQVLGGSRSIGLFDCKLMNLVYKKSYAKKA